MSHLGTKWLRFAFATCPACAATRQISWAANRTMGRIHDYSRRQAEECREQADRSRRAVDKAAWLRIAGPVSRRAGAMPQRRRDEAARGPPIMLTASSTITEGTALPGGGATPLHEPDQS